jgi:hypothetical protein
MQEATDVVTVQLDLKCGGIFLRAQFHLDGYMVAGCGSAESRRPKEQPGGFDAFVEESAEAVTEVAGLSGKADADRDAEKKSKQAIRETRRCKIEPDCWLEADLMRTSII